MFVKEMTRADCTALLWACRLGRLACSYNDQPYVVPIYYAFDGHHLYSFSMPGKKLLWMRENPRVCVQIDDCSKHLGWRSVVVNGLYQELSSARDRHYAWSLLQQHANWWEPGALTPDQPLLSSHSSHLFYRIWIEHITGRQAACGERVI
jgi:uncharacterized protein